MQNFILHANDLQEIDWQSSCSFNLAAQDVHVWMIEIKNETFLYDQLVQLLNADETERLNRFKKQDDKLRFAYAHAGLRILCSKYLGQPPATIVFTETINKKPCIEICFGNLFFNLSHSGKKILIAFSTASEVGVDIEQIRPDFKLDDFMQRNYSPSEISSIISQPTAMQLNLFFKFWSRKEAWLKATGIGIFSSLDSIDTSQKKNNVHTDQFIAGNFNDNFYIHSFPTADYWASIVTNTKTDDLSFLKFEFENFLQPA